jgi:hypothetical protein
MGKERRWRSSPSHGATAATTLHGGEVAGACPVGRCGSLGLDAAQGRGAQGGGGHRNTKHNARTEEHSRGLSSARCSTRGGGVPDSARR